MSKIVIALLATWLCFTPLSQAEEHQGQHNIYNDDQELRKQLPKRGLSRQQVIAKWGTPIKITDPVGNPPIHRLEYDKFFVVLQGDFVIRAVIKAEGAQP